MAHLNGMKVSGEDRRSRRDRTMQDISSFSDFLLDSVQLINSKFLVVRWNSSS